MTGSTSANKTNRHSVGNTTLLRSVRIPAQRPAVTGSTSGMFDPAPLDAFETANQGAIWPSGGVGNRAKRRYSTDVCQLGTGYTDPAVRAIQQHRTLFLLVVVLAI